jgi:hypothetical protein|tara:strand:+ start:5719 stop:6927 length:1209 start_codon:yes stop_codon:yes gene_type:complete
MPSYFVGNVLPDSNAPGENDSTFDFTEKESAEMDLSQVPIRIEHADSLSVGSVQRHWSDSDGKKWILGKVDDTTLEGRFASNALQPSSNGHRLYTGLSLQHVHTSYSDGTTKKRPIEISLCTEPRRAGCNVVSTQLVQSVSGPSKTKKTEYITQHQASIKMSAPTEETAIETPTETEEQVNDTTTPAATESSVTNHEDLMKLVINQESELGSTKMALQQAEAELTKMQNQWKQQQDNAELETKSKAEALSKALVDSWSASLPADMMTEENKKAIFAMAQNYPKESVKMLEIAHKASAKYKTDLDSLAARQAGQAKRALESQVMDIVTKKRRVAVVPQQESVVHAASAKVAMVRNPYAFDSTQTSSSMNSVRDKNPALFQALSGFSSGNLRERMSRIAKIDGN